MDRMDSKSVQPSETLGFSAKNKPDAKSNKQK